MSSRKRNKFSSSETDAHFVNMIKWLALESKAEVVRMALRRQQRNSDTAEKSGETILDLVLTDNTAGLGGRTLVTFRRRNPEQPFPWHRLKVGSPVVVSEFPDDPSSGDTGVVSGQTKDSIQVALTRWPAGEHFRIDLTADEVTRRRQIAALGVAKDSRGRLGLLRSVLMGERKPGFSELPDCEFVTELNPSQQSAVRFALSAQDLAIIHGPPGTGKTTTVVELIIQSIARGEKVLAVAPSNTAVDNLLERLVDARQRAVRIGHPARVAERLRDHSLDGLVEQHENMPVIRDMQREAESIFRKSDKWSRAPRKRGERQEMRTDAKMLIADARRLERHAIDSILDRASVICGTTTFSEELLGERWFDLIVIDEACQSTEPGCWVPLLRGDKIVLAGDHQQLPPTVLSDEAAKLGFSKSLMERQIEIYGDQLTQLLTVQYRMHQQIMKFSSQHFYDDQLVAHPTVEQHLLSGLPDVQENQWTGFPMRFVDTAGAGWEEELEPDGESKRNPQEADLVLRWVERLTDSGVEQSQIAVIAPYAAQVRLLRAACPHRDVEIDTVDGFQGREKEVVIITLVRSNLKNEIGFLADSRRMNVALTRARRCLIVIGDSATLGGHDFYRGFFEYAESVGGYSSVWEDEI
jgi:ATP-dependent RNA/DNA helicase IGHMBP2